MKYYQVTDIELNDYFFHTFDNMKQYILNNWDKFFYINTYVFKRDNQWYGFTEQQIRNKLTNKFKYAYLVKQSEVDVNIDNVRMVINGMGFDYDNELVYRIFDSYLHQTIKDTDTEEIIKTRNGYICIDLDLAMRDHSLQYAIVTENFNKYKTYNKSLMFSRVDYKVKTIDFLD